MAAYDVVVLGAGTAGLVTAAGTALFGGRVALVERNKMGGDCLNTGCVPSKALIRSAKVARDVRRAREFGLEAMTPRLSVEAAFERMRERRAALAPHDSKERFERLGVDVFFGQGRFLSPREVSVGERTLCARYFVIATGTAPLIPPIVGLDETRFYTNETLFDEMTTAPRSLLVLGGGPIGCEIAQVMVRLAVEVTLVELLPRLLPRDDAEAGAVVRARLEEEGVRVFTGTRVHRFESAPGKSREIVARADRAGHEEILRAEALLVATGRAPLLEGLGLEAAGVEFNSQGISVAPTLATSQSHIYACGDVVGRFQFTHAADYQARIVVRNILFPWLKVKADYKWVPWVTYTDPEVAQVGLTEDEARARGTPHLTFRFEAKDLDRAVLDRDEAGFIKVLTPPRSDRLLGATVVGPHAGEVLHELVVAAKHGIGLAKLSTTIHAYPSYSQSVQRVADAYMRSRLTPRVRSFFSWLYRRRRLR